MSDPHHEPKGYLQGEGRTLPKYGDIAQLIRVLPWHGRSRGFESLYLHHFDIQKEEHA